MYYYIFEPATDPKAHEMMAQIKELLSSLGIAGELTVPGPGKSVEDLILQAVVKRYSTIVAVGRTPLVNQVAHALEPHDAVFGIIPTVEHPDITNLIGVADWKSAAEQLKRRRFHTIRMGVLNEQHYFLTPANLTFADNESYNISCQNFSLDGNGGEIRVSISPNSEELNLSITPATPKKASFWQSIFSKDKTETRNSSFYAPAFDLTSPTSKSISVAESTLCNTPVHFSLAQNPLKLIVGKGVVA